MAFSKSNFLAIMEQPHSLDSLCLIMYLTGRNKARTTGKIILMYGQGVKPNTQSTSN